MADDCIALVRHLELPKVHLAGHSMGGMIVQDCAIRYPDVVDRIVLAATAPVSSARDNALFASWATLFSAIDRALWFRNLFFWVFSPSFFDDAKAVDALVQLATAYPFQQSPAALWNQVRAIAAFDATKSLSDDPRPHARPRGNRRPAVPDRRRRRAREGDPARDVRADRGRRAFDPGRIPAGVHPAAWSTSSVDYADGIRG